MKQNTLLITGIFGIMIILIIFVKILQHSPLFQDDREIQKNVLVEKDFQSIKINLTADFSSSEGSRYYTSSLIFKNYILISGRQIYETWSGTGNHTIAECILNMTSLTWIDKNTSSLCKVPDYTPLDKKELIKKINSNEFKPIYACPHNNICYELFKEKNVKI